MTSEELLSRLIAFDTTSRLSNLDLLAFVEARLEPLGFETLRLYNSERTKANLFATIGPRMNGGIVLSGHTDVVPVDGQPWDSDPFRLTKKGERLYGRGTADMKSFLAVCLALAGEMAQAPLERPIHLAFSYDEEVGCIGVGSMIRHIVEAGTRPSLVIVGEPTSMRIVNAHKSIRSARTAVTGLEAHSSRTHEGVSAIVHAAELVAFLSSLGEEMKTRGDPSGRFDPPYTSLSIGLIEGGTAVNIIPRACTFAWEYRALPGANEREILERFMAHCDEIVLPRMKARFDGARIETVPRSFAPGLRAAAASPEENLLLHLAGQNSAHAVSYATEGGLFQADGFPTFVCGPGDIAEAHKPNEFIDREQIVLCEAFIRRLIAHLSV